MVIRQAQLETFEQAGERRFEDEMVAHSKVFSPRLAEVLGEEQLRLVVVSAISRARGYRFTLRGPIRLFIEMMFLCGNGFDTDPQYETVGDTLRGREDEMLRAQRIHEDSLSYLSQVSGPNNENVRRALRRLLDYTKGPVDIPLSGIEDGLHREMSRMFPEKAAYIGQARLQKLIEKGRAEAARHQFHAARQITLIVTLMFSFGHACTADPLYPWIQRTLEDPRIGDAEARSKRLEKKAVTWLEHVLDRHDREQPL